MSPATNHLKRILGQKVDVKNVQVAFPNNLEVPCQGIDDSRFYDVHLKGLLKKVGKAGGR